jgi:hypothetical protein
MNRRLIWAAALTGLLSAWQQAANAANGEMGTGVPQFAVYSAAVGPYVVIWGLVDSTIPFPAGCSQIRMTPTTMGVDSYKAAIAVMTAARLSNRPMRFYAHADRDGGCGVDYFQLN